MLLTSFVGVFLFVGTMLSISISSALTTFFSASLSATHLELADLTSPSLKETFPSSLLLITLTFALDFDAFSGFRSSLSPPPRLAPRPPVGTLPRPPSDFLFRPSPVFVLPSPPPRPNPPRPPPRPDSAFSSFLTVFFSADLVSSAALVVASFFAFASAVSCFFSASSAGLFSSLRGT